MGLFKKIKDIFYDEVEVPVKEEPKKEEKPAVRSVSVPEEPVRTFKPIEPVENTNNFSERELFKTDKTFDFPVFEEEDEEPIRTRSKTNILELQKELEEKATSPSPYRREEPKRNVEPVRTEPTKFRPSPVISPVYGILDKNYKKEEVIEKKKPEKPYTGEMSYDYVRRKAYGTLEDELEDTLTRVNSEIVDSVSELEKEIEAIPRSTKNIEDLLSQIEQNANVSIGELEERAKDKLIEEDEEPEEEYVPKREAKAVEATDNTLEHDLFNLIDSMYDDKEE